MELQSQVENYQTIVTQFKVEKDIVLLKNAGKKLSYLAINFDPYNPHFNTEIDNIMDEFQLRTFIDNPFHFTNRLLQLLDILDNNLQIKA